MIKLKTDILIIGAGAAGISAAWNLRKTNYKIVCLEQGPKINRKEFRSTHKNWESLYFDKFNFNPNKRLMSGDYPIDDKNSDIAIANFNGVGGSSVLYSGHVPRFHSEDFNTKKLDNVGYDWPINLTDLEKYYEINENKMKVRGIVGDPAYPNIKKLYKHVPLGRLGEKVAEGFNQLGWHWWPSYSAINLKKNVLRDKYSINDLNNSYLKEAIKDGVKIYKNHKAIKILLNNKNKVDGVVIVDDKKRKKFIKTSILILAASALGTPRLLLNSKCESFPNGLANNSGLVGKNLMLHPYAYVEGVLNENVYSHIGPKGCCIFSHEFYKTKKKKQIQKRLYNSCTQRKRTVKHCKKYDKI